MAMENETPCTASTPMVHSVLHAIQILELFAAQRKEYLSLTEISRSLKMHKTTVYRILRTLQSAGWIDQSNSNGQYRLGTGILLVSSAVSVHRTSRSLISEEMRKLAEKHNETVVLSALRGNIGICVDMVRSHHSLSISSENGYIVPLEMGATGKTLLASQSEDTISQILSTYSEEVAVSLEKNIREIQKKGYCISEGEVDVGVVAIAVPLPLSDCIYTLTISGPAVRLRQLDYMVLKDSLLETANAIQMKSQSFS